MSKATLVSKQKALKVNLLKGFAKYFIRVFSFFAGTKTFSNKNLYGSMPGLHHDTLA